MTRCFETPKKDPKSQPEDERMYATYTPGPATIIQGGIEPSPESTFGESARTGSHPATPEALERDQAIILSFRDQYIENVHGVKIRGNDEAARVLSSGSETSTDGDVFEDRPRKSSAQAPRAVRVTAENAQAVFPPNACVFVANLLSSCSDEELQRSVHALFSGFGNVYVKVRRDSKGMPFCFCQYQTAAEAERAVNEGRGLIINGRECRTELAKATRSGYLSRIVGGDIPEREARQLLEIYGAIEHVWYATRTDREMFGLPEGIWVQFAFYDSAHEARRGLRGSRAYRFDPPEDFRSPPGRPGFTVSPVRSTTRTHGRPARNNAPINVTNGQVGDQGREIYVSRAVAIGLHAQQIAAIFNPAPVNMAPAAYAHYGMVPYYPYSMANNMMQQMGTFGSQHHSYGAFNGGYPPVQSYSYAAFNPSYNTVGGPVELPAHGN